MGFLTTCGSWASNWTAGCVSGISPYLGQVSVFYSILALLQPTCRRKCGNAQQCDTGWRAGPSSPASGTVPLSTPCEAGAPDGEAELTLGSTNPYRENTAAP